jgi:3-hydroxybutyryl-CoA dehydrogenase
MDVAVLGAGPDGRDLAALAARAGHDVHLHDAEATAAMDAIDDIERHFGDAVDAGDLGPDERDDTVERLDATTGLEAAVGSADVVLVTVPADESQLQGLLADVEDDLDRNAIVAVTVGEHGVTAAAAGLRHPDRAVGLSVPEPLAATVAELVVADQTDAETVERAETFVSGLGLDPAVVADEPGGISTRLSLALEVEAMRLVVDGAAGVADVDAAYAQRFDLPMGPLERADRAGLDERLETLEYLAATLGGRFSPPPLLRELVEAGHTGAASGEGFYVWEGGDPTESALPDPDIVGRVAGPDDPAR